MPMSSCDAGRTSPDAPRDIKPPVNCSTNAPERRTGINREPHMARKAFVVTDAMREKVRYLDGVGVRKGDIAKIVGCDPKTLRKRVRDEQDRGESNVKAPSALYSSVAARGGSIASTSFRVRRTLLCRGPS